MKKLAIYGCGKLGRIVAMAVANGLLPEYELVGLYSRTQASAQRLAVELQSKGLAPKVCATQDELLHLAPDYIAEASSPAGMRTLAIPALERGISIVGLSIGAFADDAFYAQVAATAKAHNARVYVASGATGGFDVLRTATLMGGATAEFINEKGPDGLKGTAVYDDKLLEEQRVVFQGTAKEAIALFPTKVNVTVAAARASVSPDNLRVVIHSSPYFKGDTQKVVIRNAQVHASVDIYSRTSEIAGWSVVATLQNIVSPIVF